MGFLLPSISSAHLSRRRKMKWEFYLSQTESHFSPTVKPEGAGHPRVLTAAYPTSILFRILFPKRAPSFLKLSVLFCESKRSGSGLHPIYRGRVAHSLIQSLCCNCLRPEWANDSSGQQDVREGLLWGFRGISLLSYSRRDGSIFISEPFAREEG